MKKEKQKTIRTIEIFIANHQNSSLRNHALKGTLLGKRSISAGSDLKIIFEEFNGYTFVVFLDLGKHNRVYK